jgi:hypothetical protein
LSPSSLVAASNTVASASAVDISLHLSFSVKKLHRKREPLHISNM